MGSRLSTSLFTSVLLLICLGISGLRQFAGDQKAEGEILVARMAQLEKEKLSAQFKEQLALEEARESRNTLARYLPSSLQGKPKDSSTYQLRSIASVVNSTDVDLGIERASTLLEKAKAEFRSNKFEASNERLHNLVRMFPDSVHGPEARFLLVEGHFQSKDYEGCIEVVEEMIRLYPESELTGFALLRLARIYELRDRIEDAAEVYRSVTNHFPQPELRKQAEQSLRSVDL